MSTATVLVRAGRAEWSRIWSVRSSWVLVGCLGLFMVGVAVLAGVDAASNPESVPVDATGWDGARFTAMFALFGMVALAVMTSTADHATGAIVPTLQWTPRRGILFAARSLVIALTVTFIGIVLFALASITVGTLAGVGLPLDDGLRSAGELVVVLGCGALLGIGLGLATRSTAASLVLAIALLLVLPLLVANLPFEWATTVSSWLPGSGALFLIFGEGPRDDMTVSAARLTMVAWAIGASGLGAVRLVRSDAGH
ncbi:hypothetical protein Q9R29_03775 [Rothia sp. ARF10]|nr:hypothetical protein [Rothia sp. ARF10]